VLNRGQAALHSAGVWPRRLATLEVTGRRSGRQIRLVEVAPAERAPILRRYLEVAPGARAHVPVDRAAPLSDFERIAPDYPVFRIEADDAGYQPGNGNRLNTSGGQPA
jgi:hypothetical protein